jgi:hypothetical protein
VPPCSLAPRRKPILSSAAGFGTGADVVVHFLPPRTPELQPAEPLWSLVREALAHRSVGGTDRVRDIVRSRVSDLANIPDAVLPVSASEGGFARTVTFQNDSVSHGPCGGACKRDRTHHRSCPERRAAVVQSEL